MLIVTNRARFGRDGTFFPAQGYDRGMLIEQSIACRWGVIGQVELTVGASNSASSSSTGAYSSFSSGLVVRFGL